MWLPALIVLLVLACLVMSVQYDMPIGESLLALFLAFFFSFLAIQSTGATGTCVICIKMITVNHKLDITPLTAASKASQVILGATTKGRGWTVEKAQTLNLIGGALASIGAGQAAGKILMMRLLLCLITLLNRFNGRFPRWISLTNFAETSVVCPGDWNLLCSFSRPFHVCLILCRIPMH